jgi:hypothetical protein
MRDLFAEGLLHEVFDLHLVSVVRGSGRRSGGSSTSVGRLELIAYGVIYKLVKPGLVQANGIFDLTSNFSASTLDMEVNKRPSAHILRLYYEAR